MAGKPDDTIIVAPGGAARLWWPLGAAAAAGAVLVAGALFWLRPPAPSTIPAAPPPPAITIPTATEAQLRDEAPGVRTMLRFASNPAIVVLDFPTLAEQGRMLNRLAAWAEKDGVPHDRLLTDAELAAVIRASGATPEAYYYGHDYRAADIARFFALAEQDHIALDPEEETLRQLTGEARAGAPGFGALITLPRADAANQVDPAARATILHHELSHGAYFTEPAYTAFANHFWRQDLTEAERAAFRRYLQGEGYDPALEDLMINEAQAYLMHTADPRFFDPVKLGIPPGRLEALREQFFAGMPAGWLRDGTAARPAPRLRAAPGGRQWPGRVSSRMTLAATLPPRRRRVSMAACRLRR